MPNGPFGGLEPAERLPAQPEGQKVDLFGLKSKKNPGSRKVKYGSGGPHWVIKSVSAHFLRSGRGLTGSNWVPSGMFGRFESAVRCTAGRSKSRLFRSKIHFFLGPGRSNMGLGDHIGCPKVFPNTF